MRRRDMLSTLVAGSVAASVAGCSAIEELRERAGQGTDPAEEPTDWFVDTERVAGTPHLLVATADVQAVVEHREELPAFVRHQIERLEGELDAVSMDDVERLSGSGYVGEEFDRFGGVGAAEGDLDGDALGEGLTDLGFQPLEDRDDFDWFEHRDAEIDVEDDEADDGDGGGDEGAEDGGGEDGGDSEIEAAAAVSNGLAIGALVDGETDPVTLVEAAIATAREEEPSALERDAIERSLPEVGDHDVVVATELPFSFIGEGRLMHIDRTLGEVLTGLAGLGLGLTVEGETTDVEHVLLYEDEESASMDALESLVEELETEDHTSFEDLEVSQDGPVVVVEATAGTSDLINDYIRMAMPQFQ